jgi:hypothetical protein
MRRSLRPLRLLLGCILLSALACNKGADVPEVATPAPPVKSLGPPVTEDEARQFAEQLSQALKAGDTLKTERLLHMMDLFDRLVSDLGLSARDRRDFVAGALEGMRRNGFGQQIQKLIADGGSYKLLRVRTVGGQARALFRMVSSEGALNYQEFLLARFPDGVGMEDVYIHATGEPLSQSTRRLLLPALAGGLGGVRLKGMDDEYMKSMATFGSMTQAVRQGRFVEATAHYNRLPQKLRDDKFVLVIYMQALLPQGEAGDNEYLAVLEKFRKRYPDDVAAEFISIDYFFLKKQYDKVLKALNRLDTAVGGDPYLDGMRAAAWVEVKRFGEARAAVERAIKAEPTIVNAYGIRLIISLRERKYADTLEWLKKLVQTCGVPMDDLPGNPEYAGFVQSPQYQEWLAWYRARPMKK